MAGCSSAPAEPDPAGHSSTMLTALRCGAGLDTGDVYLKQPIESPRQR